MSHPSHFQAILRESRPSSGFLDFPVCISSHLSFRTLIARIVCGSYLSLMGFSASVSAKDTYMGRELADVMGPGGMDWLERDNRESEERVSELIAAMALKPGMQVADIGAGSGLLSRMMSPKVLPGGTIHAVDIQQEMLDRLSKQSAAAGIKNIKPILGTTVSTKLKPASVDVALMVDVYHEFNNPLVMLKNISDALKKGGTSVLVEYRGEDPNVPIREQHKMTLKQIKKEFGRKELGLQWLRVDSRLPRQHIVFFEKR